MPEKNKHFSTFVIDPFLSLLKKYFYFLFLLITLISCNQKPEYITISGDVFGTSYGIQYFSKNGINYQTQFDSLFKVINQSMSTYIPDSDISKLNRNEAFEVDAHFIKVFNASKKIYSETKGAFDPTIGVAVNAWDFGPQGRIKELDSLKLDSLMVYVGLENVKRIGNRITKSQGTFIDFNAIAKGYGVDVIGKFLESEGVENYLVEIGGEIRASGINKDKESPWRVGVEMPHFDGSQSVLRAINLQNAAMATSGTYRKFKVDEDGNRYSHIINTKTGYPSKTNLLSITVIAEDCMTADAYATAFKTMGIDGVTTFLKTHPELQVFLIFENEQGELDTLSLNNFPD